ncbi:MAG: hypothetical protein WBV60_07270 [Terriglobales bacterium]
MSDRTFVDTNVLIYAHDVDAKAKHEAAKIVLHELWSERTGMESVEDLPVQSASLMLRYRIIEEAPLRDAHCQTIAPLDHLSFHNLAPCLLA